MNKDGQRPDLNCSFIIAIKQTSTKSTHFTPIHHTKPMCRKRAKDEDMLENPYGQTSQLLHSAIAPRSLCRRKTLIELNLKTHDRWAGVQTQDNTLCINLSIYIYIYIWSFLNLICSAMSFSFTFCFYCFDAIAICSIDYSLLYLYIYLCYIHLSLLKILNEFALFLLTILTLIFYFYPLYILIIGCYILLP